MCVVTLAESAAAVAVAGTGGHVWALMLPNDWTEEQDRGSLKRFARNVFPPVWHSLANVCTPVTIASMSILYRRFYDAARVM